MIFVKISFTKISSIPVKEEYKTSDKIVPPPPKKKKIYIYIYIMRQFAIAPFHAGDDIL